ncbi:PIN domain-containing protein [Fortiea sp. LEGE XX443]|uniref:PIN domain-containing protein n=1 Tax=Fortiea sp. LEGE XX443 TaxID=1828611 RepID=UPI001880743E|nr:PIN domain-containing protein [Fortiea sp. LEGE XX443]MBE9007977.1 PIN domain-containing protein [Fortiea sp. LEGE XX443]
MNGRVLLDTNILVYIYDPLDAAKQTQASAITDRLIRSGKAVISTQIMGEFFMATTRSRRLLLTPAEALERMRIYLAACHVVDITRLITLEAIRGVETHNFQFWDAQIWATARLNQIEEIYSEDFASGSMVEGVRFTNPLMSGFY